MLPKGENIIKKQKNNRIWKFVAIAVVVVFIGFIISGLIKAHQIRESFVVPTKTQMDYADKIAKEKLTAMIGNISGYQIQTSQRMRIFQDGKERTIIQVAFQKNATTHTFLVDVSTGEVLLHTQTDIYI
jgi:hypothetical protein